MKSKSAYDDSAMGGRAVTLRIAGGLATLDRLLAMPAGALASVKRLVRRSHANSLESQLDEERRQLVAAAGHPDFAEGVGAFLQKRQPVFPSTQGQP